MRSILIVEDDVDIRETMSWFLEDEGYDVASVANGEEALAILHAGLRPRIILLDWMMPVMSGWQFQQKMRNDPEFSGIPILIVTGDTMAAQRAAEFGASGHLRKPFEARQLVELVTRFCTPHAS
jgi:CheY-like chemotaxis protein